MTRRPRTRSATPRMCRPSSSTSKDRSRSWSWGAAARPARQPYRSASASLETTGPRRGDADYPGPSVLPRRLLPAAAWRLPNSPNATRSPPIRPETTSRVGPLLAPEHGGTPLALRGQTLARVRAALHAVKELLHVVPPTGTPLLDQPPHECLHGADRERRIVRDLARELRDGAVEAQGGDDAIHEPEGERRP